ncbi:MAG: FAD-dependent thymidylate synthase [Ferrimicrobium sp.]
MSSYLHEEFSAVEREQLGPYFSNLDEQVFCLTNLGEEVKAALFARYSRSAKSLRRIFLDEFAEGYGTDLVVKSGGDRAAALIDRVIGEYGDDSVAQLGVLHVALEQVSTTVTRAIEWGRLMSYLEQSTRYVPLAEPRSDGSARVVVPGELSPSDEVRFLEVMEHLVRVYEGGRRRVVEHLTQRYRPQSGAQRRAIAAAALDTVRGILPTATMTNLGIVANAQSLEYLVVRLRARGDAETLSIADALAGQLREQIPALTSRLDRPDRGGRAVAYLRDTADQVREWMDSMGVTTGAHSALVARAPEVSLVGWDRDAERELAVWVVFPERRWTVSEARAWVQSRSDEEIGSLISLYAGDRSNRRYRPGRAFEMVHYVFEVTTDFGSFRDLARHRVMTLFNQELSFDEGYVLPELLDEIGYRPEVVAAFDEAAIFGRYLEQSYGALVARSVVPLAFRVRAAMAMNAREAMHLIELRSQPQGHEVYRSIAQQMHRAIAEVAGHRAIAETMIFVDHDFYRMGREASEERIER